MTEATPTRPATEPAAQSVGEIVAADYRTAAVFERHGIDFCCGGTAPLAAACREKGLDPAAIAAELAAARRGPAERGQDHAAWAPPFLCDYIVNVHHAYLKANSGQIAVHADKTAAVHGARHPELPRIAANFAQIAAALAAHLREEEESFFPAVKRLHAARQAATPPAAADRETLQAALPKLRREHDEVGEAIHTIRRLATDYALPGDACNTFKVTYELLKEFEADLHKHVHLENNILFPTVARLLEGDSAAPPGHLPE
ncbi:MAG: iron-sulfur cluster repair di-iron protein [Lentisphaeria bacterium]|jgi:regulator of cell morphogenesis and NO signaling